MTTTEKIETLAIEFKSRFTNSEPQECLLYTVNGNNVPVSKIKVIPKDAYPNKRKTQMRNVIIYFRENTFNGVMEDNESSGGTTVIYLKPFYDNIYSP